MKHIFNILLISALSLIFFACQGDEEALSEQVGYLRVALEQSKDVNTKAAYNAEQMHVVIKNAKGVVKFETNDHTADLDGKEIALSPGKYTIEAHSNAYDNQSGADRAYYAGKAEVTVVRDQTTTADVVCSLANVKVTVAFEQSFLNKLGNGTIHVQVKSATTAAMAADFAKSAEKQVTFFPLGDLTVAYTVVSADGTKTNSGEKQITGVKAKDHYVLNFKNPAAGTGNVTVTVDPSMHQYTYDFTVDPSKASSALFTANAWSRMAYLTASDITVDNFSALKIQYRQKGTEQWTDAEVTSQAEAKTVKATVKGLTAATTYEYQLVDDANIYANGEFTTETEIALQNGNFDNWTGDPSKDDVSPNAPTGTKFWDTSNIGANTISKKNPTRGVNSPVHTEGGMAAELKSIKVLSFFAAASLYTGSFGEVKIPNAIVNFGQKFSARPIALKGFYKYTPKAIDVVGKNPPAGVTNGQMDQCAIYIALAKKSYSINNGDANTFINFKDDPNIIAYGELPSGAATAGEDYVEFNIPLKYKNLTDVPTHIIVVCSSSKYGDYMTGGVGSTLYVDDFSLIYDGEPTMWK